MFIRLSVILMSLCLPFLLNSQCTFNGMNGGQPYSITIEISPVTLSITNNNCATNGGFNYQVNLDYDISYTGNVPNSLWTFQGNISCSNTGQTSFFNLPLAGVNSSGSTTAANAYAGQVFCPAETASPEIFGCNTLSLNIQGPGLSVSEGACTAASVAPVTLIDYNLESEDKGIVLSWQVSEVYNHDYYEIFHSADGKNWESIARLYDDQEYIKYFHQEVVTGTNYYRVQQYDYDGYNVALFMGSVYLEEEASNSFSVYPNPASENLQLNFGEETMDDSTKLIIRDSYGQVIMSIRLGEYYKNNAIDVSYMPEGLYFIQLGQSTDLVKFMVTK